MADMVLPAFHAFVSDVLGRPLSFVAASIHVDRACRPSLSREPDWDSIFAGAGGFLLRKRLLVVFRDAGTVLLYFPNLVLDDAQAWASRFSFGGFCDRLWVTLSDA